MHNFRDAVQKFREFTFIYISANKAGKEEPGGMVEEGTVVDKRKAGSPGKNRQGVDKRQKQKQQVRRPKQDGKTPNCKGMVDYLEQPVAHR